MEYAISQQNYMDSVHISDAIKCDKEWKNSLYTPLQSQLEKSLKKHNGGYDQFVYIGPGPLAPIVERDTDCFAEINKYKNIVLLDLSETYLFQAKKKLSAMFPGKTITCHTYDVTNGLSDIFYRLITSLLKCDNSYLSNISYLEDNFDTILNGMNPPRCKLPVYGADYIYSELVATYTGVPALFDFESKLNKLNGESDCLLDRILPLWQSYNELVFRHHVNSLGEMLAYGGHTSIATDVEKIYVNKSIENVNGFNNENYIPTSCWDNLKLKYCNEDTMWDDSGNHKYDESTHINTLAHLHRVGFYTYEKQ